MSCNSWSSDSGCVQIDGCPDYCSGMTSTTLHAGGDGCSGQAVITHGLSSLGDGGGGKWYWDSAADKSTADFVTIIDTSVAFTYASQGTGIGTGCWVRDYDGEIHVEWAGASIGAADNQAEIQIALDVAHAVQPALTTVTGGGKTYNVATGIAISWGVKLADIIIIPTADVDVVSTDKRAYCENVTVDASGISFTSDAFLFINPGEATQGHQNKQPVWSRCKADLPANSGTGFHVDATAYYVQYLIINELIVNNGAIALHLEGSGSTYCNGNIIDGLVVFDSASAITFDNAKGNTVSNLALERNSYSASLNFEASLVNRVMGIRWDSASITFDSDSHRNYVHVPDSGEGMSCTDAGQDNLVAYAAGEKRGYTSFNHSCDLRPYITNPGRREFIDNLAGGVSPYWTQTLDGTASITYDDRFLGYTTDKNQWLPSARIATDSSGTAKLDFGGVNWLTVENNSRIHLMWIGDSSASGVYRIGAQNAAGTSGIYFEQDVATYSDNDWHVVVNNGGTTTTSDTGQAAGSTLIMVATIDIQIDSVTFYVGRYLRTSGGDNGSVGRGTIASWDVADAQHVGIYTITTNIPTGTGSSPTTPQGLEPVVLVEDAAADSWIDLFHFHIVSSFKATTPN